MPNSLPCRIIWLKNTASTSSKLREMFPIEEKRLVVTADFQSDGRGQGDHRWHSADGKNLLFSLYLGHDEESLMRADCGMLVTMASSLAVTDFLLSKGVNASIKAPNDIYVGERKICGMLIENGFRGERMDWTIIGMGLNLNECDFPSELPNPVSLSQLCGHSLKREDCLVELLGYLLERLDSISCKKSLLETEYASKLIVPSHQGNGIGR